MNKRNLIVAGAMLFLLTAFSVEQVRAQTCVVPPTCEELGYDMTEDDCDDTTKYLKCPFDKTKVYCPQLTYKKVEYPCTSGYYITISDPGSNMVNNCNYNTNVIGSYKINFNVAALTCRATNARPVSGIASTISYSDSLTCQSAWQFAANYGVVGCCDSSGKITNLLPPMFGATEIVHPITLGGSYYVDDVVVGTIIELTSASSGKVATLAGMTTKEKASELCQNYKVGGLNWTLASMYQVQNLASRTSSLYSNICNSTPTTGYWVFTTDGYGPCSDFTRECQNYPESYSQCAEDAFHKVVCVASF